jgi:signal transduction histidine kinase
MDREAAANPLDATACTQRAGRAQKLFCEIQAASIRVDALRASHPEPSGGLIETALQELDCAHEELRVAEEHVHAQADAIAFAHGALELQRRTHRELFDAAPEAYLVTDLTGRVREANRRAAALLNIDEAFISGKPLAAFVGLQDRPYFRETLALLEDTDHASFELPVQPRGALNPVFTSISVSRALGPDGEPAALRWLLRDVGPAREMQQRLQERIATLEHEVSEQASELKSTKILLEHCLLREESARQEHSRRKDGPYGVMAEMARALRRPLSSISGWLQILGNGMAWPEAEERAFPSMKRSIRMLTRMVDDMADQARAAEGSLQLDLGDVDLSALLCDVVEDCVPAAKAKELQLIARPLESTAVARLHAHGDMRLLRRAFDNLLGNALRLTRPGGEVSVSTQRAYAYVVVVVDSRWIAGAEEPDECNLRAGPRSSDSIGLQVARRIV